MLYKLPSMDLNYNVRILLFCRGWPFVKLYITWPYQWFYNNTVCNHLGTLRNNCVSNLQVESSPIQASSVCLGQLGGWIIQVLVENERYYSYYCGNDNDSEDGQDNPNDTGGITGTALGTRIRS